MLPFLLLPRKQEVGGKLTMREGPMLNSIQSGECLLLPSIFMTGKFIVYCNPLLFPLGKISATPLLGNEHSFQSQIKSTQMQGFPTF